MVNKQYNTYMPNISRSKDNQTMKFVHLANRIEREKYF